MADYLDVGHSIQRMLTDLHKSAEDTASIEKNAARKHSSRGPVDPNAFLRVRDSVCVVGYDRQAVAHVKNQVGALLEKPFPIEGFHVKTPTDLNDGALLVPKLLMVARHCPGRKLLDEDGDEGQLDLLYDEAVEIKADVMLIYIDLPRTIYKPMRHIVHHPKLAEMVFPTQPLLRRLAADNCLVTVTEKSELNNMQKNVLREWLTKPVNDGHPVYKVADYLSTVELSRSGAYNFNKSDSSSAGPAITYYRPHTSAEHDPYNMDLNPDFQPATEEHPLVDKKKREKKDKKEKGERKLRKSRESGTLGDLVDFDEAIEPSQYTTDAGPGVEMRALQLGKTNYGAFGNNQAYDQFV